MLCAENREQRVTGCSLLVSLSGDTVVVGTVALRAVAHWEGRFLTIRPSDITRERCREMAERLDGTRADHRALGGGESALADAAARRFVRCAMSLISLTGLPVGGAAVALAIVASTCAWSAPFASPAPPFQIMWATGDSGTQ